MRITVAICTWNRCELLRQTLDKMTKLSIPANVEWELLVINNNSTDATDDVIDSFSGQLPCRRLFEPEAGISNARNLAVHEASGDYILWTDDDVLVDDNWLAEYRAAFQKHQEAAIFGGPAEPWFEGEAPEWLLKVISQVSGAYAIRDLGETAIEFTAKTIPYGANYAIRAEEHSRYRYDPRLGRKGTSVMSGEETTLVRAMLSDDASGWWVPGAKVKHFIPKHRQTTRYLRDYFFGLGIEDAFKWEGGNEAKLFERPRWLWKYAVQIEARYRIRRIYADPEVWVQDLIEASRCWGQLRGLDKAFSQ